MNKRVILGVAAMAVSASAVAQSATGDCYGTLGEGPAGLRLVVHLSAGEDAPEALRGTLDSPDQNAFGIPLGVIEAANGRLAFTVPSVGGEYEGSWDQAEQEWRGRWSQGGAILPLNLGPEPPLPPGLPAGWRAPADAALHALIEERNAPRPGQGIVIGVIEPEGARIVAGNGEADAAGFGAATLFEIGSISKVFTALILADMVAKGELALDTPAETLLPAGHRMPEHGRKITLADLASHVSGLPRLPDNLAPSDPADPYADYGEAQLLAFLDGHALSRAPGAAWEYSNLGAGLLGYLLGRAAGSDYATVLRKRITEPLGMVDTMIELPAAAEARLAPPLDAWLRPTKPWRMSVLAGAGGIRSTADDMLKFARAALEPHSPLARPMQIALATTAPTDNLRVEQVLGWQTVELGEGRRMLVHDGGTGGFRTSLALEPERGRAALVLMNSAAEPAASDLAWHVLAGTPVQPTPPVPPAPAVKTAIEMPRSEFERVVGRYDLVRKSRSRSSSRVISCALGDSERGPHRACSYSPKRHCTSSLVPWKRRCGSSPTIAVR
jgi:CubicO group peptidase (beta-lactamase class C family)